MSRFVDNLRVTLCIGVSVAIALCFLPSSQDFRTLYAETDLVSSAHVRLDQLLTRMLRLDNCDTLILGDSFFINTVAFTTSSSHYRALVQNNELSDYTRFLSRFNKLGLSCERYIVQGSPYHFSNYDGTKTNSGVPDRYPLTDMLINGYSLLDGSRFFLDWLKNLVPSLFLSPTLEKVDRPERLDMVVIGQKTHIVENFLHEIEGLQGCVLFVNDSRMLKDLEHSLGYEWFEKAIVEGSVYGKFLVDINKLESSDLSNVCEF